MAWQPLVNKPTFSPSTMLLLTDGSVMCHEVDKNGHGTNRWRRLTPDENGSYMNGSWSAIAPMHHTRLYYASAVLNDGRVFVAGGEYSDAGKWTKTAEIYDPLSDNWSEIAAPAGWVKIGDAPCTVLPDGRVLLGNIFNQQTAIYDPVAGTWSPSASKGDPSAEESWVLLSDDTILTVECSAPPRTEKYVLATNAWIPTGDTPNDLVEAASYEIGAGVVLPDGRAFFIGATPYTALYTPGAKPADTGRWAAGPAIPRDVNGKICGAKDAPACLMPNGHVLITVGPVDDSSPVPTYFYEFDGKDLVKVPDAPNTGAFPFEGRMLLLPTGEILYASGTPALYAYTPTGSYRDTWRPEILSLPTDLTAGLSYTLVGRQLNGLSQAVGYGDDASAATNYPIVKLRSANDRIFYCRTFGHSTMGIGTGIAIHTTNFFVASDVPPGSYELTVIANGIPSRGTMVSVLGAVASFEWEASWTRLVESLADGPIWSIGTNGPIAVDSGEPKLRAEVRAARRDIVKAIKVLQKVGRKLHHRRLASARTAKPAIDPVLFEFARATQKT
ncbi:MAG: hypothetical protein C5B58_15850 [Acidobacteria bacterium]|nr:MAG: hypothetical protein C5B58_15850 [Acidobacteriota bacterium]